MPESTQHKLDRVRRPRVQITYDVEIGNAIEKKEIPFVVGIMADLSGDRDKEKPFPTLRERKFVEIDRDNFNEVLASISPRRENLKAPLPSYYQPSAEAFLKELETKTVSKAIIEALKANNGHLVLGKENFKKALRAALGEEFAKVDDATVDKAKVDPPAWLKTKGLDEKLKEKELTASFTFQHLDDFSPVKVLQQSEELSKLFKARQQLTDLLAKLDGNDKLIKQIREVAKDKAAWDKFKAELAKLSPTQSA